jgi:hypothetical protein
LRAPLDSYHDESDNGAAKVQNQKVLGAGVTPAARRAGDYLCDCALRAVKSQDRNRVRRCAPVASTNARFP